MEIRNVIKGSVLFIIIFTVTNTVFSQKTKSLLFDKATDSLIIMGKTKYYKIDNNLFDLNRYNKIDTICYKNVIKIKFTTVNKLWEEGKKISDSILAEGIKKRKIKIVETNNKIFENIFVFEKVSDFKYIKTRVWWIDY